MNKQSEKSDKNIAVNMEETEDNKKDSQETKKSKKDSQEKKDNKKNLQETKKRKKNSQETKKSKKDLRRIKINKWNIKKKNLKNYKFKNLDLKKMKEVLIAEKNRKKTAIIASVLIILLICIPIVITISNAKEDTVYKETEVYYGNLTVGITESSTVDIGTLEQSFELDLSSLVSTSSTDSSDSTSSNSGIPSMNSGGGMDMFSQIFSLASGNDSATSSSENMVEVESILVNVGEQIEEGDPILTLTESSVSEIREQLAEDVVVAKLDLEEVESDQVVSRLSAAQTYESNIAYGEYAETEYSLDIKELYDAVEDAQEAYELVQEELVLLNEELVTLQEEYKNAKSALVAAEYSIQSVDKYNNTYWYVQYENTRDEAENTVESLESNIEKQEESIELAEADLEKLLLELNKEKRALESGLLTVQETYDLRVLAYDYAEETKTISLAYLDNSLETVEETYYEMAEKLDEIDDYIIDQQILSEYSGVITEVSVLEGDQISLDTILITLYDDTDVTMSATVSEDSMESIALGTEANIVLTAYDAEVYKAEVTEISDATYNSNTGENEYTVTVTILGEVSGLYQGMTGNITFITKEMEEVLYVSNRAIFREGTKSYVKVMNDYGKISEKTISTGFSDGINVEIVEGLSEGDIVLIESKVTE